MPFVTELSVTELEGGRQFALNEDLVYQGARAEFRVPAGFVTDFASIPRLAQWLVTKLGRQNKAAVIHDWLYVAQVTNRKDADGIFLRIMREDGVSLWKRRVCYRAVRIGGWAAWNASARRKARERV